MLRSFIAIEIPAEIQNAIAESTASLRSALPKPLMRWVTTHNLHLTLKFLGDVAPANLEQLAENLKKESASHAPFSMTAQGLGAFPSTRRPRVVWIGLEAPPGLTSLQHGMEAVAAQMGYAMEERPFSPHLTIGRSGGGLSGSEMQKIRLALESTQVGTLGNVPVKAVHIFKSDLQPGGAVYTGLYSLPLQE